MVHPTEFCRRTTLIKYNKPTRIDSKPASRCDILGLYQLLSPSSLNPYSFDAQSPLSSDSPVATSETLPFGAISLFATGVPEYYDAVGTIIAKGNAAYNEFLRSEEGIGFNGQVWEYRKDGRCSITEN